MPDDVAAPVADAAPAPEATPTPPATIAGATKDALTPSKPLADAPWSKDLAGLGIDDPEALAKFDAYMREKVQPHATQLEQGKAGYDKMFAGFQTDDGNPLDATTAAQMASELLNGLASDPEGTVRDIMKLMAIDPAKFAQVKDEMEQQQDEQLPPEPAPEANPEMDWVKQQMEQQQHAREDKLWEEHLTELEGKVPGFNRSVYTVAMAQLGPDPDTVMQWYNENVPAGPAPDAPAVTLGESNLTPPEVEKYGSIKDAVKSFAADMRASRSG